MSKNKVTAKHREPRFLPEDNNNYVQTLTKLLQFIEKEKPTHQQIEQFFTEKLQSQKTVKRP